MTFRIGFLLLPGFSLLSYASAVEPLRGANQLSGRDLYAWSHVAVSGRTAAASNGAAILAEAEVGDAVDVDALFVCAAGNPARFADAPTFRWLRRLARGGMLIGGVSGGAYVLARAGLLAGRRCTIHWEHVPAFREDFPEIAVEHGRFVLDRDRLTCAGGVAALDMMHALIERHHGAELATAVSDWYLHTEIRGGAEAQRASLAERYRVDDVRLLRALAEIERRLSSPPTRQELATAAGTTLRTLERLFAESLGTTIGALSQDVRLDRARLLLRQSRRSVLEVADLCGFTSASHFSRAYKARFGHAPRAERAGTGTGRTMPVDVG
ncbi:GlxA family transcriptional regulator [Methylobacterium aquaticum]|uniref:GlxA family transcriptional regulator n=1 Tax=Methylobacterium aquaticum TaxID=270351 RepID=UPI003D16FD23